MDETKVTRTQMEADETKVTRTQMEATLRANDLVGWKTQPVRGRTVDLVAVSLALFLLTLAAGDLLDLASRKMYLYIMYGR